jgi:pimeloyl-ACP methyl ester carboxylesterase
VPTLVVSGDTLDEVCITVAVELGIAGIGNPRIHFVRVPGAAHCIRREQPEAYYAAVDSFLESHL